MRLPIRCCHNKERQSRAELNFSDDPCSQNHDRDFEGENYGETYPDDMPREKTPEIQAVSLREYISTARLFLERESFNRRGM